LGIWRNIGKIVILLFQIVYEQVKWYIGSWSKVKRVSPISPSSELNNIQLSEEEESRQRSNLMVELCEQPHLPTNENELEW
jgi:hypothetical protein